MKGTIGGEGEIVQVQGGHILRATGRKDRHSKVYTSKGPRDRRVRLSAHTAIQFYDVQDRLGYDRPSKAVDWLINKAKTAIDKLNEVPNHVNNPSSQTPSSYLIQPNNNNNPSCSSSSFMAQSFSFPGFSNEDLGLSLQTNTGNPFQESFQRMDFNGGGDVNLQGNSQMFSQGMSFSNRELLLQSNLEVHPWSHPQNYQSRERDFGNPFELGFRVPARIYGEEDDQNHS